MNDIKAPLKCDRCHGPLDSISRIYSDEYDDYDIDLVCSKCYDKYELKNLKERIKSLRSQIREKQKYLKCVKGGGHYFEEPEKIDTSLNTLTTINLFNHQTCLQCGYGDSYGDSFQFNINGNNLINIPQLEFKMPDEKVIDASC